eukprot:431107-Prorocentrum_minimum.AAC.1
MMRPPLIYLARRTRDIEVSIAPSSRDDHHHISSSCILHGIVSPVIWLGLRNRWGVQLSSVHQDDRVPPCPPLNCYGSDCGCGAVA